MAEADVARAQAREDAAARRNDDAPVVPTTPAREWVRFGAIVMVIVGGFSVLEGVIALAAPDTYVTREGTVLAIDLAGWAWLHIVLGALVLLSGLALLRDALSGRARAAGVTVVGLSAIVQLAWLPAAPIWSIIMIALDVLVLGAIVAVGNEHSAGRR
ncbi:DUF7144 family membrane protein [Actinomycetospora callitridis]|uniref:DUF7144 family membrane protein n=1 Tax=Actinomycetospora callitridis TaxID=913944 RepID=UPI002366D0FF|nr:hypothetical protein [Actinomycetospora callitridis]MDD7920239.1 hypothetical protein [Actinomycetospora callitridis]